MTATTKEAYRPRSNILFSGTIPKELDEDYQSWVKDLKHYGVGKGLFALKTYTEHYQGAPASVWNELRE